MFYEGLLEKVLLEPSKECNQLKIISGYGSPSMAYNHLEQLKKLDRLIDVELTLGMVRSDGIGAGSHKGFQNLVSSKDNFLCSYCVTDRPVHAKSYIWLKDGEPRIAFCGSGNYSQRAFFEKTIECFTDADPVNSFNFYNHIQSNALSCLDGSIERHIEIYKESKKLEQKISSVNSQQSELPQVQSEDCITLSLLVKGGEVPSKSGLNWGQRDSRDRNQAYLSVPSKISRSGFFPPRAQNFTLVSDDGYSMNCVVAQSGDKAIHTTESNAILGRYFRERIGIPSGAFVTKADLDAYGRTDVMICKIDSETYFLDFSV